MSGEPRLALSSRLLAQPWLYWLFQYAVGPKARKKFLQDYAQLAEGQSILDVGCGPGLLYTESRRLVPNLEYLGLDIDPKYVANAQKRLGAHRFQQVDVCRADPDRFERYDRVLAYGLLHHLSDEEADRFFAFSKAVLKPGGKVVTLDGTLVAMQNRVARVIIALDRGQNIRAPEHYRYLATAHLPHVHLDVRHDLQAVPYSCAVLVSSLD